MIRLAARTMNTISDATILIVAGSVLAWVLVEWWSL
jgi:hypothetical protein